MHPDETQEVERPNRAQRRAAQRRSAHRFLLRRHQRPFRSAFSGWTDTMRTIHGVSPVA